MSEDHACPHCSRVFKWGGDDDSHYGTAEGRSEGCGENAYWKLAGHIKADHPDAKGHRCGRRDDGLLSRNDGAAPDFWQKRDGYRACSYCGSMHPDDLFAHIKAGTCQISGTDKNYKIYVDVAHPGKGTPSIFMSSTHEFAGGVLLTEELCDQHALNSYARANYIGHWVKIEPHHGRAHAKFYYQHFDEAQQQSFIDLYNLKKLPLEPRFGLYRLPYFATRSSSSTPAHTD